MCRCLQLYLLGRTKYDFEKCISMYFSPIIALGKKKPARYCIDIWLSDQPDIWQKSVSFVWIVSLILSTKINEKIRIVFCWMLFCKMVQETWSRSLVVPLTSSFCMKNNSFFRTNSPIYFWNFFYPENNWSPDLPNVVASIGKNLSVVCTYISQVLTPFLDQFLISQGKQNIHFPSLVTSAAVFLS